MKKTAIVTGARRGIGLAIAKKLLEGGYQLLHLHLRGGDLDEIYRRYFEKAGESGEHPTAERKRPGILEQLWKKQKS